MPLHVRFVSGESENSTDLSIVYPGEVGVWINKTDELRRFIIAKCLDGDYGAAIHSVSEEKTKKISKNGVEYSFTDLNDDTLNKVILAGLSYEIDNIQANGEIGHIVLRHVAPDGLIFSES